MSFGNLIAGSERSPPNLHWLGMQGRFTLEVNVNTSDIFSDTIDIDIELTGGLWVHNNNSRDLSLMKGWRGDVKVEVENRTVQESTTEANRYDDPLVYSDNSLYLNNNMTWFPVATTRLHLWPRDVRNLLTGEAVIVLRTGNFDMIRQGPYFLRTWQWTQLSKHNLNLHSHSNSRDQLVIKAPTDIAQKVAGLLNVYGHVWFDVVWVSKSEFDAFWASVISQHGDHSSQATRASVLAWARRPTSVDEPMWQANFCFAILASLGVTNINHAKFHESSQVLASRERLRPNPPRYKSPEITRWERPLRPQWREWEWDW
jgi:hypothetical protein